MDQALPQIEATYSKVLEEHSLSPPLGEWELVTAVADYMLVPAKRIKELTFGPSALQPEIDSAARRQESMQSNDLEPHPWLQVFADQGSGYNETDSMHQQIGGYQRSTLRFLQIEKLHRSGRLPIRIDLSTYRPYLKSSKFASSAIPIRRCFTPQKPERISASWFFPRAFFPTLMSMACSYSRQVRTRKFICLCLALWGTNRALWKSFSSSIRQFSA